MTCGTPAAANFGLTIYPGEHQLAGPINRDKEKAFAALIGELGNVNVESSQSRSL